VTHCRPSPCDRLSRPRSTTAAPPRLRPSAGVVPIRPALLAGGRKRNESGRFPRSLLSGQRGRHPALPLRHRHGYAAVLHRGLPTGKINPIQEFPPMRAVRTAIQPRSTGFELVEVLRGFTPLVPRVHLPVSLAGPAPSGSAGASRRCRGCFPPGPVVSPGPAAPSFYRSAATDRRRGLPTRTRITAPRGARTLTSTRNTAPHGALTTCATRSPSPRCWTPTPPAKTGRFA
jgi:hypothetical protein